MKPVLVIIENDATLDRADYVNYFRKKYEGEVIELTRFGSRSREEIYGAVSKCTDIAVQTCFIGGSDNQLYDMVKMLAKIPHTINVYIAYISGSDDNELYQYLVDNLYVQDLLSIQQHNIYAMSHNRYESLDDGKGHLLLDFSEVTRKVRKERSKKAVHDLYIEHYKETARTRTTGRKILVLGCIGFGKAFTNLPIGEEVDELICDKILEKGEVARGVWIWGNGEPIMLVNDSGFREYKIATKLNSEGILKEIAKAVSLSEDITKFKEVTLRGLLHIIEDEEEVNISKANLICEQLEIPKRGNRQAIYTLLNENA